MELLTQYRNSLIMAPEDTLQDSPDLVDYQNQGFEKLSNFLKLKDVGLIWTSETDHQITTEAEEESFQNFRMISPPSRNIHWEDG